MYPRMRAIPITPKQTKLPKAIGSLELRQAGQKNSSPTSLSRINRLSPIFIRSKRLTSEKQKSSSPISSPLFEQPHTSDGIPACFICALQQSTIPRFSSSQFNVIHCFQAETNSLP